MISRGAKERTAALWAIATALAVIAALLALIVMINATG